MNNFDPEICPNCGYSKFRDFEDLDPEERIVAERRQADDNGRKGEHLVCARCFMPISKGSELA